MILEIYTSGDVHPALYDAYVNKDGKLYGMQPPPPDMDDIMQVVLERDFVTPNKLQYETISFLKRFNEATDCIHYNVAI